MGIANLIGEAIGPGMSAVGSVGDQPGLRIEDSRSVGWINRDGHGRSIEFAFEIEVVGGDIDRTRRFGG